MTQPSDFDLESSNNAQLMHAKEQEMLKHFMEEYKATMEEVIDFMYNANLIKKHGYGVISVHVQDGKIVRWEAMMRTLRYNETQEKLK